MESYNGQEIIDVYVESLYGQNITDDEINTMVKGKTEMTYASIADNGGIQFRFETDTGFLPVCQYVTIRNGEVIFRDDYQWFVPGDVLFKTFSLAVDFTRSRKAEVWASS